jgi:hypothetical protein
MHAAFIVASGCCFFDTRIIGNFGKDNTASTMMTISGFSGLHKDPFLLIY